MVFSSLTFLFFFLPIVMLVYFAVPMKGKNIVILISGIVFYAWGEPFYIFVMLLSASIDYFAGRFIDKYSDNQKVKTIFLIVSVVMNLSLLGVFKYSSFIVNNINSIFGTSITDPKLPLPIGISFYTFQSMSYTIDLYMRKIKVQKNMLSFLSYVTLFPQIVAGPIVRYEDIESDIDSRQVNARLVSQGIGIFIKGLAKKVLLANNIGLIWTQVKAMDYGSLSMASAWIGILAFTFQIYFDFSGYSDMAVGLGKMLGFNFPQNFNHPYMSKSISEFWRRWHITLGSWFRSYVYIPLGGNKKGLPRTIINLVIVWSLTGLWHGASWNFMLWGFYFGVLIIIEKLGFGKILKKLPKAISMLYTFLMVVIGWVFFDNTSILSSLRYLKAMVGGNGRLVDSTSKYLLVGNIIIFIVCIISSTNIFKKIYLKINSKKDWVMVCVLPVFQIIVMVLCTAYLVNSSYNPFLYFRF